MVHLTSAEMTALKGKGITRDMAAAAFTAITGEQAPDNATTMDLMVWTSEAREALRAKRDADRIETEAAQRQPRATEHHPFVPGVQRPSSTGWYFLCGTCGGTEEAVFGTYTSTDRVHTT